MREIDANKEAWALLARDHYEHFRTRLASEHSLLNDIITDALGNLEGKRLIHLQCNTGADTISLGRLGAHVTGVDLVPENIRYAKMLAAELGVKNARFITSDIMTLSETHHEKYDIVFTSEGAIGWLPDLNRWGHTIRKLLKDDGFMYVFDSHPFQLAFDEAKMAGDLLQVRYPYFGRDPDEDWEIGGYASETKEGTNYFWMYTVGSIINALVGAGLQIAYFNEYDVLFCPLPGMEAAGRGLWRWEHYEGKLPFTFGLKATVRK